MCTVQLPQLKIVRAWIDPTWQGASRASGGCRDYIDSCESRIDNYGGVAFLRLACNNVRYFGDQRKLAVGICVIRITLLTQNTFLVIKVATTGPSRVASDPLGGKTLRVSSRATSRRQLA